MVVRETSAVTEISRKVLSGCGVRFGDERTGGSWLKHSEGSLKVVLGFGVRFVLKVKELKRSEGWLKVALGYGLRFEGERMGWRSSTHRGRATELAKST